MNILRAKPKSESKLSLNVTVTIHRNYFFRLGTMHIYWMVHWLHQQSQNSVNICDLIICSMQVFGCEPSDACQAV